MRSSAPASVPTMYRPALKAARFQDLPAEVTTAAFWAAGTLSVGTNSVPGSTSQAWISSTTNWTPCAVHSSATAVSSSAVCTVPVGLCGEHNRKAVTSGAANASDRASRSSRPSAVSATGTVRRRYPLVTCQNGGYTGAVMTMPSPGSVVASSTHNTAFITSPPLRTWPGASSSAQRSAAEAR